MGKVKPLLVMMAGAGVLAIVAAVLVPIVILATRDRGAGEPESFPSPTPVIQGVRQGQTGVEVPTATPISTPTRAPAPISTPTLPPSQATATPVPAPTPTPPQLSGDPNAGRQVFSSASPIACSVCHSLDGSPGLGPSLQGIFSRAGTRVAGLNAEDYIKQSITNPQAFEVTGFPSGLMPNNFAQTLTSQQISDLIAFLLTQ